MLKLWRKWFCKPTKLGLKEQIELIDNSHKPEDIFKDLVSFWSNLDTGIFTKVNIRYLSKINLTINHGSIQELINNLETVTRLLKRKDYEELTRLGSLIHNESRTLSLEYYLSTTQGYPIDIQVSLLELKQVLITQKEYLETLEDYNKLWPMTKLYDDLMFLTKILINDLREGEDGDR